MSCIEAARHPLLHRIAQGADWTLEDEFPSCREWADEHELWLRFVDGKGELNRFCPRLKKSAFQRDRTLSEIGIAYFLETHCSLPIIEWEPEGEAGRKGEFLVNTPHGTIFVEVKTGGWQKDIVEAEGKNSPRLSQPKYVQAEARSVAPWAVIRNAVGNAYPKFPASMPTLLVIRDDYFIALNDALNPAIALYCESDGYGGEKGYFQDHRYERLGAVGLLEVRLMSDKVTYDFALFDNPNAISTVKIPQSVFNGYPRRNSAEE